MPTRFKNITLPLTDGLDDNKTPLVGTGMTYASNVDFSKLGEVRGRPGHTDRNKFGLRQLAATPVDQGAGTMFSKGNYIPRAMFRYRDSSGERPGIVMDGRVFVWELGLSAASSRFTDHLWCGAARVDRLIELLGYPTSVATNRTGTCDTFAPIGPVIGGLGKSPILGITNPSIEMYLPGQTVFGNGAIASVGGSNFHCVIGNDGQANNFLQLQVRKDDDFAINAYGTLASDCFSPTGRGDVPVCCSDSGATVLYVAYILTAGNSFKVLRVDPSNGTILTTYTSGTLTGLNGIWVTSNTSANKVIVTVTQAAVKGVKCRTLSAGALVDQAVDAQFDSVAGKFPAGPVVCGQAILAGTAAWVAYATFTNGSPGGAGDPQDVVVGYYTTAGVITTIAHYLGNNSPALNWGITHQPVLTNSGRAILGLMAGSAPGTGGGYNGHTWYDIDLTDYVIAQPQNGGLTYAGILARGPLNGSTFAYTPQAAILETGALAWRFPTVDFQTFDALGGENPSWGLNRVSVMAPQVAQAGEETVIGGSVPHMLARGHCTEVGFPFLGSPEIFASPRLSAGFFSNGSYTFQALWKWTDSAGQIHRSGPSLPITVTTDGTHQAVDWTVLNCQLTERLQGEVMIEVYMTDTNPTANSVKYLMVTSTQAPGNAATSAALGGTAFTITTGEVLYTVAGVVFANAPVQADGGCATVGRRIWLSDGVFCYSSKLLRGTKAAPAWNDTGQLQVTMPVTAGRVIALEALDDKLVILCERGIFITQGDGPDDTGAGNDFLYPVRVSDLGCAGPRSAVSTDKGVVFHASNTNAGGDVSEGGLWLLDRGLGLTQISLQAETRFIASPADLTFIPERQLLIACVPNISEIVLLDMRTNKWNVWTPPNGNGPLSVCEAAGVLWAVSSTGPGSYDAAPGFDDTGSGPVAYAMTVVTDHLYADGESGLGWARIKGLTVLGELATHVLTMSVTQDQLITYTSRPFNLTSTALGTQTWPSDRYAPEWRLPNQKCSQLQVTLTATPATGAWSALRINVLPLNRQAPINFRQ